MLRNRIDSHFQNKDFWDRGIVFTASNNSLNKAHVRWLESALISRAVQAKRCMLDNGTEPQQVGLSEAERADTEGFLREVLQILPLVGLRAFEIPRPVATPQAATTPPTNQSGGKAALDTIIVPAQQDGFDKVFVGENC